MTSSVSLSEETEVAGEEQVLFDVSEPDSESPLALEVPKVLEDDAKALRENPAFQPVQAKTSKEKSYSMAVDISGTCWACNTYGEAGSMMWYEREWSHLIHATAECIKAAQSKQESKEHKG